MEERTSDAAPPANITHADWEATPPPVRQLVGRLLNFARQKLTDALNASTYHLEREQYDGARVSLTRALEAARVMGDQPLEVWLLAQLSQVEAGRGHVALAEEQAREALKVAGAVGDDKLRALALNSLGVALLHSGQSGILSAVDHLRRAVDLARASGAPVLAAAMINLANALLHSGNLTEAAEWAAAFTAAEQARARSLVEEVARSVGLPGGATPDAPQPDTRADRAAYAELRDRSPTTVASLRAYLDATEDELAQLPRPGGHHSTPRRAILASYAVGPGAMHLFVLRSDMEEPELFSEPLDDTLRRFVGTNFGSARRVRSLLHGASVRLWYAHNRLIAPLATYGVY